MPLMATAPSTCRAREAQSFPADKSYHEQARMAAAGGEVVAAAQTGAVMPKRPAITTRHFGIASRVEKKQQLSEITIAREAPCNIESAKEASPSLRDSACS